MPEQLPRNTCEITVGCLMEIRVAASYRCVADVDHMIDMMNLCFDRLKPGDRVVIAADWRAVSVMSPDTAARAREMLAGCNPRVLRSSILVQPDSAMTGLQVLRLVREAENDHRRHFTSAAAQCEWLSDVLDVREMARVRRFLGEHSMLRTSLTP